MKKPKIKIPPDKFFIGSMSPHKWELIVRCSGEYFLFSDKLPKGVLISPPAEDSE